MRIPGANFFKARACNCGTFFQFSREREPYESNLELKLKAQHALWLAQVCTAQRRNCLCAHRPHMRKQRSLFKT
jgi:hypothetical protein